MRYAIELVAERKIQEAMERGDFDNLRGKGKPLPPDGLDNVPPDLRMAYKILKNAGVIPEEVELRKNIVTLNDLIASCDDAVEGRSLRRELNEKQLRYNMLVERRNRGPVDPAYHDKIMRKLR